MEKKETPTLLYEFKNRLIKLSKFSSEKIESEFKSFLNEKNIGMGKLLPGA